MKHRLLFVSAIAIALLVAVSALGSQPAARADTSSLDWDVNMTDAAPTGADPSICPSDADGSIDVNECPEITSSMWMDTKDATSNEASFDQAPQIWQTGPPGTDLDSDGLAEPSAGVAQLSNLTVGTTVGEASFSIWNNIVLAIAQSNNNIDDVGATNYDSTVAGQTIVCGNPNASTPVWSSTFWLWWADTSNTNFVPNANTVYNSYSFGQDCNAPPADSYAESNVDTDLAVGQAGANARRAQGFQVSATGPVTRVGLWLKKVGTPTDDLTVQIQTDSSGVPSNTPITNGTSNTVAGTSIGSSYGWVWFQLATPAQLTTGTQYHVVLTRSGGVSGTNYYVWGADQSSPGYANGAGSVYGGSWQVTSPATDHAFQVAVGDPWGAPDGVDCTPAGVPVAQATLGLPLANYVGRAFGLGNIVIIPSVLSYKQDFNYLMYNMVSVPEVQGYLSYLMLGYGLSTPVADPTAPGYAAISQTILNCLPGTFAPVRMFGITQDPDYTVPPDAVVDRNTPSEAHLKVVGGGGNSYGLNLMKSASEDWDGDTIAAGFDRCAIDPASGTAAQDIDGDTLTGLCENPLGLSSCVPGSQVLPGGNTLYWNCEGNNPQDVAPGGWNINPPFDSGQDVDRDGFLNMVDKCPNVPDRDLDSDTVIEYQLDSDGDTVGDVCEIDLVGTLSGLQAGAESVVGNGQGYPGQVPSNVVTSVRNGALGTHAPGQLVDRDNVCSDPFTVGTAETLLDSGRWCAGFDLVGRPYGPTPSGISALGRQFADSNDDVMPDLLDYPVTAAPNPIEWMDVNSDSDADTHTDACEAFMGSDPLASASVPAGPPPAGDCDNDGTADASDSTPFGSLNPDADRDGCARSEESPGAPATANPGRTCPVGSNVCYQDSAWYDFYTVPVPALKLGAGTYDTAVTMSDVLAVLSYVGDTPSKPAYNTDVNANTVKDGLEYDRSPSYLPDPPADAGPPDAAITMGDVLAALAQVGKSCSLGSHF